MAKSQVLVLKDFDTPKEAGKHYCFFCLNGEKKGQSYYLIGESIKIGRSQKLDFILNDSKVSREHAAISRKNNSFILKDLGSQNGVFVNNIKISEKELKEGDQIIIGRTVFRFSSIEVIEKPNVIPFKKKINGSSKTEKKPQTISKKTLILIVVLLSVLFLFDDDKKEVDKKRVNLNSDQQEVDIYTSLVKKQQYEKDMELAKKLETIFQRGLREYREGNYFRAVNEFNLALILSPNNSRASYYLNKTKQALDKYIEDKFISSRKQMDSVKYNDARVSYCSIIRLLKNYKDDKRYQDAQANLNSLEEKMGLEKGSINCFGRSQ